MEPTFYFGVMWFAATSTIDRALLLQIHKCSRTTPNAILRNSNLRGLDTFSTATWMEIVWMERKIIFRECETVKHLNTGLSKDIKVFTFWWELNVFNILMWEFETIELTYAL